MEQRKRNEFILAGIQAIDPEWVTSASAKRTEGR